MFEAKREIDHRSAASNRPGVCLLARVLVVEAVVAVEDAWGKIRIGTDPVVRQSPIQSLQMQTPQSLGAVLCFFEYYGSWKHVRLALLAWTRRLMVVNRYLEALTLAIDACVSGQVLLMSHQSPSLTPQRLD